MPSPTHIKRRRAELFKEQNGLCYYCKEPMLLIECNSNPKENKHKPSPPDLCTLEHLFDRYHPDRTKKPLDNEKRWAAACFKCNGEQNSKHEALIGKDELRRRSYNPGKSIFRTLRIFK